MAACRGGAGELTLYLHPCIDGFKIPFYILIVILSAFTGLYSSIIQKYTIDYEKDD